MQIDSAICKCICTCFTQSLVNVVKLYFVKNTQSGSREIKKKNK